MTKTQKRWVVCTTKYRPAAKLASPNINQDGNELKRSEDEK